MKNYIIAAFFLLFLTVASLLLPSRVLKWQDGQRTGKSETEEVQEVVLKEQISMTLSEKLELRKQDTVNTLALVNGKNYNRDTIEEQIKKEIKTLAEQDILINFNTDELTVEETTVTFYVDMEDSERSIMLWQGYAVTPEYELSFFLDDETGKIVSFSQYVAEPVVDYTSVTDASAEGGQSTGTSSSVYVDKRFTEMDIEDQKKLAGRWGEYLGCRMTGSDSYWQGIGPGEEEIFQNEIDMLIRKGYSYEEAQIKTALAWGIEPLEVEGLRVILEDNGGPIIYTMELTGRTFWVDIYIAD